MQGAPASRTGQHKNAANFRQKTGNPCRGVALSLAMPSVLDRTTLEKHLVEAERRVADGLENICHQKEIIAQLERDQHHDAALEQARSVLNTLMETQVLHVKERDRIRAELLDGGPL
jgi:hypothetical protein